MKQSTLIWGAVVVVLVILGIWYLASSNGGTGTQNQMATTTTSTTTTTTTTSGTGTPAPASSTTFKSIFTQSGNHECDYSQTSPSSQSTSVIYISGGKMNAQFRTVDSSGSTASLMIYDGGYLYSWKEGATVGTKSSIKTLADLPAVIPDDLTSGAIFGTGSDNVGWDCHDWLTDPSVFVLPTYVTFSA
jgi:hypothetical protein